MCECTPSPHTHARTHPRTLHTHTMDQPTKGHAPDIGEEEEAGGGVVRQLPGQRRGVPLAEDGEALDALRARRVVCRW